MVKVNTAKERSNPKRKKRIQKKLNVGDFQLIAYKFSAEIENSQNLSIDEIDDTLFDISDAFFDLFLNHTPFCTISKYKEDENYVFEGTIDSLVHKPIDTDKAIQIIKSINGLDNIQFKGSCDALYDEL